MQGQLDCNNQSCSVCDRNVSATLGMCINASNGGGINSTGSIIFRDTAQIRACVRITLYISVVCRLFYILSLARIVIAFIVLTLTLRNRDLAPTHRYSQMMGQVRTYSTLRW